MLIARVAELVTRVAAPFVRIAHGQSTPNRSPTAARAAGRKPSPPQGQLAADDKAPYVIDTLPAPDKNPYNSWIRFTGIDFFPDGHRAALCTWSGDVWIVSGIDHDLKQLTWKRFATGLNNPMGVKIVDGIVYTIDRSQITKLIDLNGDGEADFYQNFNNDCTLTPNFHEMAFDLQTDSQGNFYFSKSSAIWAPPLRLAEHAGCVLKVSKDGIEAGKTLLRPCARPMAFRSGRMTKSIAPTTRETGCPPARST